MRRFFPILLLAFSLPALSVIAADEVEVADLLSEPDEYDGRVVAVVGELVGDYSPRADGVWVQVNDDAHGPGSQTPMVAEFNVGLGARLPSAAFEAVEGPPGRHGRHGPLVRLEGVFRHDDPALSGETFLDVTTVETLSPAETYPTNGFDIWLVVGGGLTVLAGLIALVSRRPEGSF